MTTAFDPVIAIAATPRDWAQRLHVHVVDHGGARVRATVLHPRDALTESFEVFVADDVTSFLTPHLVAELHRLGRGVVGVYDADDERGKGELVAMGVDALVERSATADDFVRAITGLAVLIRGQSPPVVSTREEHERDPAAPAGADHDDRVLVGHVLAVGAPPGGCGATELAIALAGAVARAGARVALVDGDDVAPSLAQRLGLEPYPNLRTAVDELQHRTGRLLGTLTSLRRDHRLTALVGLAHPRDWSELQRGDAAEVVGALARSFEVVVVNVGGCLEDLGGPERYAQTRGLLAVADSVVAVGLPTPVSVARLLEWVADLRALPYEGPVHGVINQHPGGAFKRAEVANELAHSSAWASITTVPFDGRVHDAAWAGGPVAKGPFTKAVDGLAARLGDALPRGAPGPARVITSRRAARSKVGR